jgi:hypothetical protein
MLIGEYSHCLVIPTAWSFPLLGHSSLLVLHSARSNGCLDIRTPVALSSPPRLAG